MFDGLNTELRKTVRIDIKTFISARPIFLLSFASKCAEISF